MSRAVRHLAALLAFVVLAVPLSAQEITGLDLSSATLGSVVRISGTELGTKPKLALVQDGKKAKGSVLKVVGSGEGFVDAEVKKAKEGSYEVAVAKGKTFVTTSEESLAIVPPAPESVDPASASPKDEVDVLVSYPGEGKLKARVGLSNAKVLDVTPVEAPPGESGPQALVTIRVPNIANGLWPISIENAVGEGILKSALEIVDSNVPLPKPSARLDIVGAKKKFNASKKKVTLEEDGDGFAVVATTGSAKFPTVLRITVPEALEDVEVGDSYSADPGQIVFSTTDKNGTTIWAAEPAGDGNTWVIDVVALDDDGILSLFLCGCLTRQVGDQGDEALCISGLVTVDTAADDPNSAGVCDPLCTATGSITGAFVSEPNECIALAGTSGPGTMKFATGNADAGGGFPQTVIEWTVSFDPLSTPLPATYDSLSLSGQGLSTFSMQVDGFTFYTQAFDVSLNSSMSVTITQVDEAPTNPFGILACIHGTFTGVVNDNSTLPPTPQTLTGTFEIPWYDSGFGQ